MKVKEEQFALETQRILNTKKVEVAKAEKEAAQEFAKAREAAEAIRLLEIQKIAVEKWNGNFPANTLMVPGGKDAGAMLFNLPMGAGK